MIKSGKMVYVFYSTLGGLIDVLQTKLAESLPGVKFATVVDDSLLADVRAAGRLTAAVTRRLVGYGMLAQSAGADAIFNTCSSIGEAADVMRQVLDIPVVKIDEAMAQEAVEAGERVAVVATLPTTLAPTARLVERMACEEGREVSIRRHLVEGAFDVLVNGDPARHNQMIMAEIERAAEAADVIVLAQGSMARLVPSLPELPVPVLSSPDRGIADLRRVLESARALGR